MAREVGTEGVLGGQASVRDAKGIWKELTDNVNSMANNLTNQVRNIAEVATSVAGGDLSKKITVDAKGEVLDLKNTLNAMVDQLNAFASEVTRVAREVGVEGKLGGQAAVAGVRGTWKELTDNVNMMASNLTNQVRDIAEVTTGVANGDLSRKIVVDARGEILELKNTINTMVDHLNGFASEVTRLANDVGVEGKLGGQADVRGVSGTCRNLTDAVNSMANNLTDQVRNIALVARAIAEGDLQQKIVVDARGEIFALKNTINTMVDQLNGFADEVTRVARDVGVEGKLGGQAQVRGVRGTWKELTENVNMMASNLTNQVRDISQVSTAIAQGDLGRKVTVEVRGELLELKVTINTMVDQLSAFAHEVTRVARDVGVEGKLGGQADVRGVSGIWKELTDNVNMMSSSLTNQVRDIAEVTTAVAQGDLSRKITVEVRGEILELKNTINTMVDQLSSFADEVTRVAREVGTEGVLGGQAEVRGVSGTWRELTDNVNLMARNLTEQVRGIARVVTAVANGNLRQELKLATKGEIAALVTTINGMIETLSVFADQVSGVARDVGFEGKLGGQANVPGAAGIWRDLTSNVNELAGNLTRQVRAIGDVATAVTKGDLTQSIDVEARGEVAMLKDNINQMILTLAETTRVNEEQDWLKTQLAQFTRMLQGQRELSAVAEQVLSQLAPVVDAQHGAFYVSERDDEEGIVLKLFASYAFNDRKRVSSAFRLGEGLVGQAARERKRITITNVPSDYIQIGSALGEAPPRSVVVVPIQYEGSVKGVIELASFHSFTAIQLAFLDQLLESLGIVVATIEATMRTDELLRQSQSMAVELRTQQDELQLTNEELEQQARALKAQRDQVERKNTEVELAKAELEEKAEQLSLTSKYKSQFLANMSHELRTPLNSLLILSRQLAENREGNLTGRQVEFAETIHHSGADLLTLISEILDLAKIESGTMALSIVEVSIADTAEFITRSFQHIAEDKHLAFSVAIDPTVPTSLATDDMRLKQVLRNLLSNAFKFTDEGSVMVHIESVPAETPDASPSIAFSVRDTGIGVAPEKQRIIFEAFQQADGGTSRRYGGTGLGLSISREIATLLGGRIRVESTPGEGSCFTLQLPTRREVSVSRTPLPARSELVPPAPSPLLMRKVPRLTPSAGPLPEVEDDRERIGPGDRAVLVVEDDPVFGRILIDAVRARGLYALLASDGQSALAMARRHKPRAITLDLVLPEMDGWALLERLKTDPETAGIPVHVVSAIESEDRALSGGAVAVLRKPVAKAALDSVLAQIEALQAMPVRGLLVVEDDPATQRSVAGLLSKEDLRVVTASSGEEALAILEQGGIDCMVVDLRLPGMSGEDLVVAMRDKPELRGIAAIVYTGRELSVDEGESLARLADGIVAKDAYSAERLLAEVGIQLERRKSSPAAPRALRDQALAGKTVLIADDDMRNIYALTALAESFGMKVLFAEHGKQALEQLAQHPEIDLVLMDVMMPEMDGLEATRAIRKIPQRLGLPIVAVTAKAMKGDRDACIVAGANDYLTKPVDREQLFATMMAWLYR